MRSRFPTAITTTQTLAGHRMGRRLRSSPIEAATRRCGCRQFPAAHKRKSLLRERKYLKPMGRISLKVVDTWGKPVAARVFVTAADGRAYAPDDAWMHADDSFTRSERPFEAHYFDTTGVSAITVPAGEVEVDVMRGFENHFEQAQVEVKPVRNHPARVESARCFPIGGFHSAGWTATSTCT